MILGKQCFKAISSLLKKYFKFKFEADGYDSDGKGLKLTSFAMKTVRKVTTLKDTEEEEEEAPESVHRSEVRKRTILNKQQ